MTIHRGKSVLVLLSVAAGVLISYHNCGPARIVHQKFPPIGETVTLEPVSDSKPVKSHNEYKNTLVYFASGNRTLEYTEDAVIRMYASENDDQPLFETTAAELQNMHEATGCDRDVWRHLENAFVGDALFCNGRIDLSQVKLFTYSRPDGSRMKRATSYFVEFVNEDDDLIALTINFN